MSRFARHVLKFSFPSAVIWVTEPSSGKKYVKLKYLTVSNYADAQTSCHRIGGMLPEPRNSSENDFLNTMGTPGWFFLGLTDRETESQWQWESDGSTVVWSLWETGNPKGGRHENCATQIVAPSDASRNKKWGSMYCEHHASVRIQVICEKPRKYTGIKSLNVGQNLFCWQKKDGTIFSLLLSHDF